MSLKDKLDKLKNAPSSSAAPKEEEKADQRLETLIAQAVAEVKSGKDPEIALAAILESYPMPQHGEIRRRFRVALERKGLAKPAPKPKQEAQKTGLAGWFAVIAARVTQKLKPHELEAVKQAGRQLTAAGISIKDARVQGPERLGELTPPAAGQEATRDKGIQQR